VTSPPSAGWVAPLRNGGRAGWPRRAGRDRSWSCSGSACAPAPVLGGAQQDASGTITPLSDVSSAPIGPDWNTGAWQSTTPFALRRAGCRRGCRKWSHLRRGTGARAGPAVCDHRRRLALHSRRRAAVAGQRRHGPSRSADWGRFVLERRSRRFVGRSAEAARRPRPQHPPVCAGWIHCAWADGGPSI
jgi:hypothetical protein